MSGRPNDYTAEIAKEICELIANTNSGLSTICKIEGMPGRSTIYRWLKEQKEFRDNYAHAKELQAELLAEEILDIADETSNDTIITDRGEIPNSEWIARSRLRVDSRKWLLSKLLPKKYGDKLELTGDAENPIVTKNEHRFIVEDMRDGSETQL